ncbi:MerR family transcriptional regulator [Amycolatopsis suaedae]|uniref:MerR family transcriptional regulator n=1 Tax=Amycolatopsis suaedae TaxID=2510978 RepID=A0A4Q7J5R2_9PSEU|nr:MerR family transcriptional regulator [Amycolatopsis suaedae]RZQ61643.1 MerR family transcriptional regulator [Amycolatopsis suaedae]
MDSVGVFTIGELARRTGLPVKTIRFYSDEGLLPPTDRTHAGYRLYDTHAMARLELVKTLRELGLGLPDVERALTSEASLGELATQHVEALDEQIRKLRLRRAVLRAVVKRGSELEEVKLMNKLASMSDDERKRLIDEFWDEMTEGLNIDADFEAHMRSGKPELPDDPTPEQLEAWIEFAEMVQDPDFRRLIRGLSQQQSDMLDAGEKISPGPDWMDWFERAARMRTSGVDPSAPEAQELVEEMLAAGAPEGQDVRDPEFRAAYAERFGQGGDPRAERYWQLLAVINGWPPIESRQPDVQWLMAAVRVTP